MDELFSCRNCIHNSGQTLNVGRGIGLCLKHGSIIKKPIATTCKYLHRKDLAWFIVSEGVNEHASEFAQYSGIVDLFNREPVQMARYSERYTWETHTFDSLTNALARYHLQNSKKWIFIEALTGGVDGRRAIAQTSLTRRYMDNCRSWRSSFRLTLDVASQLSQEPAFLDRDLCENGGGAEEAFWDVIFGRMVLVQEYGWHSGIEKLIWLSDEINELETFDWTLLKPQFDKIVFEVLDAVIRHAHDNGAYFGDAKMIEDRAPEDYEEDDSPFPSEE